MKKAFVVVFFLSLMVSFELRSQPTNQDCLGAIAICQTIFVESNSYTGTGNVANEINAGTSCLLSGEKNDVWYQFTVQSGGSLCFTITPNLASDDYDWAVFNLTSNSCSEIFGNPALEVACNYDPTSGATGPNGLAGDQNEACMTVSTGEIYAVNVSQFSSSLNGYTIDFSASGASIFDSSVPAIDSVTNVITCGETTINFKFSESVLCSTIDDADFTLSGPGGPFTISGVTGSVCSGGGSQELQYSATISPAISTGGSYSLCLTSSAGVTDLCGNVAPAACLSFSVAGLTISTISTTDVICFGGSTGSATVSAAGGTGTLTYNWATVPVQSGATATGLAGGIYAVTATDATGCSGSGTVTISTPVVIPDKFDLTCDSAGCDGNASVTPLGGTTPYSYQWTDEFYVPIAGETSSTISNLCAGAWCVITTDAAGCADTTCVTIVLPSFVITPTTTSCIGLCDGIATLTSNGGTPPFTYTWENPLGTPISGETDSLLDSLCAGKYYLSVATGNSCTLTDSVEIVGPLAVNANITTFKNACFGVCDGSATVVTSGGSSPYTYTWDDPAAQATPVATGLCQGSYEVLVYDANGCGPDTANITLTENPEIITTTNVTNQSCDSVDGSATAVPTGGTAPYSYLWDNPGASTLSNAIGLFASSWLVVVTDSAQCTDSNTVMVGYADSAKGSITLVSPITCEGACDGELVVVDSLGIPFDTVNWDTKETTAAISNLCPDTFTVTATDPMQCPVTLTYTLTEPDSLDITATFTDETSCNSQDGSIVTVPSGGTVPYTFIWSPSVSTTESASNLTAGTYSITVDDANNCPSDTVTVTLTPPPPILAEMTVTDATCFGANDGTAEATLLPTSGGAQPYIFTWSSTGTLTETDSTSLNSAIGAGTYSVSVTDINNCDTVVTSEDIKEPDIIATEVIVSCVDGEGVMVAVTTGGTLPYDYLWSEGSIIQAVVGVEPGTYTVSVSDINNCPPDVGTGTVSPCEVEIPTAFTPNDDGENDLWDLKNIKYFAESEIRVYNRWGDLVYKSVGYDSPWDGKHRVTGTNLPTAVYYYIIENVDTEFIVEGSKLVGSVTIVRP
ncbi:MAG: gliding motility-associated C-terminal domain-containing protein [Flavobacteriales bacterium]|nr:gliding motility-associated C-terminal domain-containing protein [Flavobacteriales bacterium]